MATNTITFPIKNADGTPFYDLVLHKATYDSVVMSLGDKITGDVYFANNALAVTMQEYIEYKRNPDDENELPVRFVLVDPPTIVREGTVSDNGDLHGMTKYSFTFYHPMYMLANFPFTDVAVSQNQEQYLAQNKAFSWIGTCFDYIDKLNKNLASTQWVVVASANEESVQKMSVMPKDVLSFDKNSIADALKTCYDTWEVPYIVSDIHDGEQYYDQGKRFLITIGLPSNEILDSNNTPYIFRFGQGVGLKNNSRTPRNNKIITRLAGSGSERNIPFGYPQILWEGESGRSFTYGDHAGVYENVTIGGHTYSKVVSYPIYKGIVGGQYVELIKHPFTRKVLMPSIYTETVNKKVNPYATDYNPDIEIVDYYDAIASEEYQYPNPINPLAPSFENHQFEDIYPRLGEANILGATPYDTVTQDGVIYTEKMTLSAFNTLILSDADAARNKNEEAALHRLYAAINGSGDTYADGGVGGSYTFECEAKKRDGVWFVEYTSDNVNFKYAVAETWPQAQWDDTMNDDGEYVQSYFKITLPQLSFDIYACAAITEEMKINMRSGDCVGCTFPVMVDWEDYKHNFYDQDGNFAPNGTQRNLEKYPNSANGSITIIAQKETDTFGKLMPNIYQQPKNGDVFVVLGISLPTSYITSAEQELDDAMMEYMLENNVYYYDYPLKFDEYFLTTHENVLSQIHNNSIIRFIFANEPTKALYVKQISIKYGESPLPKYDITLADDIDIVLNKIGHVTDDVSRMRVQVSELQKYYSENIINSINERLSKVVDDICQGRITFQQGLNSVGDAIFGSDVRSQQFENGLYSGTGWRIDKLGNAEFESARVRSYLEVVEMIVNRMQAQEGDTLFSDNDQIDKVERVVNPSNGNVSYVLSLKQKYDGYVTCQMYGNVIKGIINTLAAKQAGVSDETETSVETDGENKYYTSWMQVVATHATEESLDTNQIRVVLYGDNDTPSKKNFEPCELMTIARWGCVDYSPSISDPTERAKAKESIIKRQRMFAISTSEGRVVKYTGVDKPILSSYNYGVTIGELPQFVKEYSQVHNVLEQIGEHTDWLYAQGIVVANMISITRDGIPIPDIVDCGEWVNGNRTEPLTIQVWDAQQNKYVDHVLTFPIPSVEYNKDDSLYIGHGIYFNNKYNAITQRFETHEVWHNKELWLCLQSEPVVSGGTAVFYEPEQNSPYWEGHDLKGEKGDKGDTGDKGDKGDKGDSSITVSLSNEMDSVPCSPSLKALYATNIYSGITVLFGLTDKTSDGEIKYTSKPTNAYVYLEQSSIGTNTSHPITASYQTISSWKFVRIHFNKDAQLSELQKLELSVRYGGIEFPIKITINGIKAATDGTSPTIYNLAPSLTEINVSRSGSAYVPSRATIKCGYIKKTGDTTPVTVEDAPSQIDNTYNIYVRTRSRSNKQWESEYSRYGESVTHQYYTSDGVSVANFDAIEFIICTETSDVVLVNEAEGIIDRETIPIVSDGQKGDTGDTGAKGDTGDDGDDAVVYNLMPSLSEIRVDRDNLGNYTPNPFKKLRCGYTKSVGGVITSVVDATGTIDDTYRIFFRRRIRGTYDGVTNISIAAINVPSGMSMTEIDNGYRINGNNVHSATAVYKLTFTSKRSQNIRIRICAHSETNYDLALLGALDSSNTLTSSNAVKNVSGNGTVNWYEYTSVSAGTHTIQIGYKKDSSNDNYGDYVEFFLDGDYETTFYYYNDSTYHAYITSLDVRKYDAVEFIMVAETQNTSIYGEPIGISEVVVPVVSDGDKGDTGDRGKTGRWYYYGGDFDGNDGSKQFVVSDVQTPFFSYTPQNQTMGYYIFNPDTNGTYTMSQMGTPSNNAPWVQMDNQFKFLITEAIFGSYAQFGSAVINGDFMLSMNGKINNREYNNGAMYNGAPAYTYFYSNPFGSFSHGEINQYPPTSGNTWQLVNFPNMKSGQKITVDYSLAMTLGSGYLKIYSGGSSKTTIASTTSATSGTATYTIPSDGNYSIEFYCGSYSSRLQSVSFTYKIEGVFVPNWYVDLKTGKMVAAAGNFITDSNGNVEVSGTVRAQNFFHKVCVSDGTYYSNYKYYSNGAYYDIEVSGSKKCSYDADFVHVYVGASGVVFLLPMPWDFDGKLVTINSYTTAQQALNFEVQCPFQDDDQNAPNVFPEGVYVTNSGIAWTLLSYKSTIRAGIQVAFLSQKVNGKSYWLRLGTNYGVV